MAQALEEEEVLLPLSETSWNWGREFAPRGWGALKILEFKIINVGLIIPS